MSGSDDLSCGKRYYKLVVQYDGTRYSGWQRQRHAPSVQQALEETLEGILGHPVRADSAGRTDRGVHALGQVVRIATDAAHVTASGLMRGANTYLPADIRIGSIEECDAGFDPRGDARRRWYRYSLYQGAVAPVLDRHRLTHVYHGVDWGRAEDALGRFEGAHDFQAFRSSMCEATRTFLDMRRAAHVDAHPVHHLDFVCRSFLHNMIRLMAGLVLEVGRGRHRPEVVTEMLESRERTVLWRKAPPEGLVLMEVGYEEEGEG